jgi:hypothetical protein
MALVKRKKLEHKFLKILVFWIYMYCIHVNERWDYGWWVFYQFLAEVFYLLGQ